VNLVKQDLQDPDEQQQQQSILSIKFYYLSIGLKASLNKNPFRPLLKTNPFCVLVVVRPAEKEMRVSEWRQQSRCVLAWFVAVCVGERNMVFKDNRYKVLRL